MDLSKMGEAVQAAKRRVDTLAGVLAAGPGRADELAGVLRKARAAAALAEPGAAEALTAAKQAVKEAAADAEAVQAALQSARAALAEAVRGELGVELARLQAEFDKLSAQRNQEILDAMGQVGQGLRKLISLARRPPESAIAGMDLATRSEGVAAVKVWVEHFKPEAGLTTGPLQKSREILTLKIAALEKDFVAAAGLAGAPNPADAPPPAPVERKKRPRFLPEFEVFVGGERFLLVQGERDARTQSVPLMAADGKASEFSLDHGRFLCRNGETLRRGEFAQRTLEPSEGEAALAAAAAQKGGV